MTDDLGATIGDIAQRLDAAAIPYMIVGSIAALVHGRARATMDVDIVIATDVTKIRAFVDSLSTADFYASMDAAIDAVRRQSQFNVLDLRSGWKVDLMVRRTRSFSLEEFTRRASRSVFGRMLPVASLEDTILAKLEWAQMGGSDRQLDDARALVELATERLDLDYLDRQAQALGITEAWNGMRPR
jgi:hypothetical protein